MDAVLQSFGAGCVHGVEPVGENGAEDIDNLTVAARLLLQLALNAPDRGRQLPFLERRAIPQRARLACEDRDVM